MKLYIKQRLFSWGKKFDVYDQNGNIVYHCAGEVFTIGNKLKIYDIHNNEVAYIEQEVFRFLPRYHIYCDGHLAATIIRKFSFFRHDFSYERLNWSIEGEFMAHDYRILNNGKTVLSLTKHWFTFGDSYELDINPDYNPVLVLASSIIIDCVCHDNNHHH